MRRLFPAGLAVVALFALSGLPIARASLLDSYQLRQLRPGMTLRQEANAVMRPHRHRHRPRPVLSPVVTLEKDGYKIDVSTFGASVALAVSRGNSETAYLAKGIATSRRIAASFGRFGEIDMHFHLQKGAKGFPCRSHIPIIRRKGVFAGSLRFSGENHYLQLRSRRASGSLEGFDPRCLVKRVVRRPHRTDSGDELLPLLAPRQVLAVGRREGLISHDFLGFRSADKTVFFAIAQEALGSVAILRLAVVGGSGKAMSVDNALTNAEATPPRPFHGTGTYAAGPDGTNTWLGGLTASFPGSPRTPLAGEGFSAEVWRPLDGKP